jgi:hypothetical protein
LVRWAEQEHGWTVQVVYPQFRQLMRYAPEVLEVLGGDPGHGGTVAITGQRLASMGYPSQRGAARGAGSNRDDSQHSG